MPGPNPKRQDRMAILVADCPRCGARRMSFDVQNSVLVGVVYGWQHWYEAFCVPALSSIDGLRAQRESRRHPFTSRSRSREHRRRI